jgi:hypothetical protein
MHVAPLLIFGFLMFLDAGTASGHFPNRHLTTRGGPNDGGMPW